MGHDDRRKKCMPAHSEGDARNAWIGVAHNRLRCAAGQMSGKRKENRIVGGRANLRSAGVLREDHAKRQAVFDFDRLDGAVAELIQVLE